MQILGRGGYADQDVAWMIDRHSGVLRRSWRFNVLELDGKGWHWVGDLTPWVTQAVVSHDSARAVKRTLSLTMAETAASDTIDIYGNRITQAPVNFLYSWIQPVYRIQANDGTNTVLEFSLGLFTFTNPQTIITGYMVERQAELADATYVVSRADATAQKTGSGGTLTSPLVSNFPVAITISSTTATPIKMIDVVIALLRNSPALVFDETNPVATLPGCGFPPWMLDTNIFTSSAFDALMPPVYTINPGTSYLEAINQMLYFLNCDQVWVTEGAVCNQGQTLAPNVGSQYTANGLLSTQAPVFTTERWPRYQDYNDASIYPSYAYTTEQQPRFNPRTINVRRLDKTIELLSFGDSIVMAGTGDEIQMDNLANVINVIVEDSSRDSEVVSVVNMDPLSPISVPNYGRQLTKVVQLSGIPGVTFGNDWAVGIAHYEMMLASSGIEKVTLLTGVNPCHQNLDVIALNLYSDYVRQGQLQHQPVVVSDTQGTGQPTINPIVITEKFLELTWEITITLPTPGSGADLTTTGITTGIEARSTSPGATMKHTLQRVTSLTPRAGQTAITRQVNGTPGGTAA